MVQVVLMCSLCPGMNARMKHVREEVQQEILLPPSGNLTKLNYMERVIDTVPGVIGSILPLYDITLN